VPPVPPVPPVVLPPMPVDTTVPVDSLKGKTDNRHDND